MSDNNEKPCVEHNGMLVTVEDAISLITCEKAVESNGLITPDILQLSKQIYGKYNNRTYTDGEMRTILEKRNEDLYAEKHKRRKTQSRKKVKEKDTSTISMEELL